MEGAQSFERRDRLLKLEEKAQAKWDAAKAFEVDAPAKPDPDNKFMVTFPYPYMNGRLHLGHAFSLTKSEFAAGFNRLQGKKTLWPFGFHCTGMPIQACANKLKNEYAAYGSPLPNFPPGTPEVTEVADNALTIGWTKPTSTGGHELTGFKILMKEGEGEFVENKVHTLEEGKQQTAVIDSLTNGVSYAFKIVPVLKGAEGTPSKASEASKPGVKEDKKKEGKEKEKGKPKVSKKVAAKTGSVTHQWDIMRGMEIEIEDIPKFTDPIYWLKFFPPHGMKDLKRFGVSCDFRRSFITTDQNPFYDMFVRWQFAKLREGDFIAFGKRPTIYSEVDGQACMDHDRAEGEGVGPQEYTGIKMKITELPPVLKQLEGMNVYCVAATLRPETMCGQTNCWILMEGEYGCFKVNDTDVYICSHRAARNMSFQDLFPVTGKPECLCKVMGKDLLGVPLSAPLAPYDVVYMLPLPTIKMNKGTGVVTSVPSDSPDDYAAFMDLKNAKKREFYGVKEEWVEPFALVPIITTPDLGDMAAEFMCKKLKVQSPKDVVKLQEAHDIVYKEGFYKGTMVAGPYSGKPVQEAKLATKKMMVEKGMAFTYLEPEKTVVSRSGDDCVVALVDQWYLKYGEEDWKKAVAEHLDKTFHFYTPAVQKAFEETLEWLQTWACSRSFGLGTRLPWDQQFLIESLSDSTIYMAYYTIAHMLQGGIFDGGLEAGNEAPGSSGIKASECTEAFFDYIFLGKPYDAATIPVAEEKLKPLKQEFDFWYPMDLRVSGRDLIQNHLTMSLYNHAAVWKEDPSKWPKSFYTNGFVLVNKEKMSKSKGNFLTLDQAISKYSADAARFTCADAGDGNEDANYAEDTCNAAILRLTKELEWIKEKLSAKDTQHKGGGRFMDKWFAAEMQRLVEETKVHYGNMFFREALRTGFFEFQTARSNYRQGVGEENTDIDLVLKFIEYQAIIMAPIIPHWAEECWELLGKSGLVVQSAWPVFSTPFDTNILRAGEYLFKTCSSLNGALDASLKPKKGKKPAEEPPKEKPNQINVYIAHTYPAWQIRTIEILQEHYDKASGQVDMKAFKALTQDDVLKPKGKQVAPFANLIKTEVQEKGVEAFELSMPFDEPEVLKANKAYLLTSLGLEALHIYTDKDSEVPDAAELARAAPGKPTAGFFFGEVKQEEEQIPVMDYLNQHQVSEVLNQAVNEALKAHPEDPIKWIGEYLLKETQKKAEPKKLTKEEEKELIMQKCYEEREKPGMKQGGAGLVFAADEVDLDGGDASVDDLLDAFA